LLDQSSLIPSYLFTPIYSSVSLQSFSNTSIHLNFIEVFTGYSSTFPPYQVHYFSSIQFVSLFIFIFLDHIVILFYVPDTIHCKVLICTLVIVFIIFWFIQYSSYPTFMWSNKLFSLLLLNNQSVSIAYNFTFYFILIYQLYFIRFMSLSIPLFILAIILSSILHVSI